MKCHSQRRPAMSREQERRLQEACSLSCWPTSQVWLVTGELSEDEVLLLAAAPAPT